MNSQAYSFKEGVSKIIVKVVISIVGLLIIMAIFDALPMIKTIPPIQIGSYQINNNNNAFPNNVYPGGVSSQNPTLPNNLMQAYIAALTSLIPNSGSIIGKHLDLSNIRIFNEMLYAAKIPVAFILPQSIINAIFATLIFIVLIISSLQFSNLIKIRSKTLPAMGNLLLLVVLLIVAVIAYGSYYDVIVPLIGFANQTLYELVFLVLGVAPLVGIIVVGSQNMDAITGTLFSSSKKVMDSVGSICPKCGTAVEKGAKFCPTCGENMISTLQQDTSTSTSKKCLNCEVENKPDAKFCKKCGKPV